MHYMHIYTYIQYVNLGMIPIAAVAIFNKVRILNEEEVII